MSTPSSPSSAALTVRRGLPSSEGLVAGGNSVRRRSVPLAGLATVVALVITSNTDLAIMPGNVFLPAASTGLPRDSVVEVTAVVTLNKADLAEHPALRRSRSCARSTVGAGPPSTWRTWLRRDSVVA
jgi:hypothetical protein